ncbi:MAG: tRNA dihydrouridine(20/20a) synthase DusA [Thiogranum sp.]
MKAYPISVAPMMDWTDRHCRYFLRLVSPRVRLYTEMITTAALMHGDRERLLAFDASEHPLALQLGGSEPGELAACARLARDRGYDEINLNVGCPSDRVQSGRFGACLMLESDRVANCVRAMRDAVSVPVTVKCRLGVDERDSYAELVDFVGCLVDAGLEHLIVHARKAWLQGLSPKQNREVPPLDYARVYRLKADFPQLQVDINGGFTTAEVVAEQLHRVDGVMIGRAAYHDPWLLARVESSVGSRATGLLSRHQVAEAMLPYVERELAEGVRLQQIARHMLGLFSGQPGARAWRRYLSEHAHCDGAGPQVLENALRCVPENLPKVADSNVVQL